MKKVVYVLMGVLLVLAALSVGCTKEPTPTGTTPTGTTPTGTTPTGTQNVSGTLINITPIPGSGTSTGTLNVRTEAGPVSIGLSGGTKYFLDGVACNLEDILAVENATGISYNCSVAYNAETGAENVYVATK